MLATSAAPYPVSFHVVDSSDYSAPPLSTATDAAEIEIDSRFLLRGHREICIRHGGQCYRLRHTRNDKLILTK